MMTASEARELALSVRAIRAEWDPIKGPSWLALMALVQSTAAQGLMRLKVHNLPNEARERLVDHLGFTFTLDKNEEFLTWDKV